MQASYRSKMPAVRTATLALMLLCVGAADGAADSSMHIVDIHKPADREGQVDIENVSGSVEIAGWDKAEIAVGGTTGADVERVDVTSEKDHATVRVVLPARSLWHGQTDANLVIHVPRKSLVSGSTVSAAIMTHDLPGEQRLRTVSGDIDAGLGQHGHLSTVSGKIKVAAAAGTDAVEIDSISGDIAVNGPVPDIHTQTVSGVAVLKLGSIRSARLKTISGNVRLSGSLAAGGRLEAESVSGDFDVVFNSGSGADYDIETHSGKLTNCFGPAPEAPRFGPGLHLVFRDGDGSGRVHMNTLSGAIRLCNHP